MWLGYFNLASFLIEEIIMLVSVVIGLLNEEKFLPKLIEDFKNQTYDHSKIELIFMECQKIKVGCC